MIKALIRLRRCAVWSAPLLLACGKIRISRVMVELNVRKTSSALSHSKRTIAIFGLVKLRDVRERMPNIKCTTI